MVSEVSGDETGAVRRQCRMIIALFFRVGLVVAGSVIIVGCSSPNDESKAVEIQTDDSLLSSTVLLQTEEAPQLTVSSLVTSAPGTLSATEAVIVTGEDSGLVGLPSEGSQSASTSVPQDNSSSMPSTKGPQVTGGTQTSASIADKKSPSTVQPSTTIGRSTVASTTVPAPVSTRTTKSSPGRQLPLRGAIALPGDRQPSTPSLPAVGSFIPMPGTGGTVEYTVISNGGEAKRHHYAKRSAIDPFNTYIIFQDYLLDFDTLNEVAQVPFGYEFVVSQRTKHEFFGFVGNKFSRWNAATGAITEIWAAPAGTEYTIGQWEGQQSWDDRYIPLVWKSGGSQKLSIIDITKGTSVGQIDVASAGSGFNWADISPRGTYVLVGNSDGVFRYDINLTNKTKLNTTSSGNAHGDVLFDVAGNEVFAQEGNFYDGDIAYTILKSNVLHRIDVVNAATQTGVAYPNAASHISGQAADVQGRLFVSLQNTSGMSSMFTVDLVPGQTKVQSWGHSYTTGNTYESHAKATMSNDGNTIVWSSDSMGGTTREFLARKSS